MQGGKGRLPFAHADIGSLPSLSGPLVDDALNPELAVEFGIEALTALFNPGTFAALRAESCFVFLTDRNGIAIRMVSAIHRFSL